jgi:hypothetical protein
MSIKISFDGHKSNRKTARLRDVKMTIFLAALAAFDFEKFHFTSLSFLSQ